MDNLEKYIRLNMDFPNKAGKLDSVLSAQKRLLTQLARTHGLTKEMKELLILVAEGYEVSNDLLAYIKNTLQEVANDAGTLIEGARMRNIIQEQSEFIGHVMDSK